MSIISWDCLSKEFVFESSISDPYLEGITHNHEPNFLEFVKALDSHRRKSGSLLNTVLDVGANIGIKSIPVSEFCQEIYAIEANSTAHKFLEKNIEANKILNITTVQRAVGSRNAC